MSDKLLSGIKAGSTDLTLPVELRYSGNSTERTGLVYSDITAYYWRQGGTPTSITTATLAAIDSAHSDGGFREANATNQPGLYRFDLPDAAIAAGADWVAATVKANGTFAQHFFLPLTTEVIQTGNITALFPSNFAAMSISSGGNITSNITGNLSGSVGSVTGAVGSVTGAVGSVTGAVGSVTGAVGSVTAGVTVTTNNDKTGYSIAGTITSLDTLSSGILAKLLGYFRLLFRKDEAVATDHATELTAINADAGSGTGAYDNVTDSVEAIRDRGDAAWITGSGGGNGTGATPEEIWTYGNRTLTGGVTVTTNNDKTGYVLSQSFPTNFAAMTISGAGKVTVGTNDDKTGYSLSQSFPTNFASMAISSAGNVTVGTNNDKTGYSLSQSFPTNFAAMAISSGGNVTVGTNNDKTGYSIAGTITSLDTLSSGILAKLLGYFRLLFRKDEAVATDHATELTAINADAGSGTGAYDNVTDSVEAIRDRGDAAWITGSGGGNGTGATPEEIWTYGNRTLTGGVTVTTNNDKTGYVLSQSFPTNFAAMTISGAGKVTVGTNDDKTGYSLSQSFPTNFASMAISSAGNVTVGTNNDKTGYSLSQSFPTNFAAMAISSGGNVTVGTNNDKTGYVLSQSFPTNFSSLTISTGGNVTVGAIVADAITASALATDAVTEIANAANATLSAAHGNSSWETGAAGNTTAIATAVDTLLSTNHGNGSWETGSGANATSLANSLGNLAVGNGSNWPEGSAAQLWSKLRTTTANATVIVMPGDPVSNDLCHLYGQIVLPSGQLASDITIKLLLNAATPVKLDSGRPVAKREITTKTDADGYIISTAANGTIVQYQPIARTDKLGSAGNVTWKISSGDLKFALEEFYANATTLDVATLV